MEDRDAGGADVLTEKRSFKSNSTLFIPMRRRKKPGGAAVLRILHEGLQVCF